MCEIQSKRRTEIRSTRGEAIEWRENEVEQKCVQNGHRPKPAHRGAGRVPDRIPRSCPPAGCTSRDVTSHHVTQCQARRSQVAVHTPRSVGTSSHTWNQAHLVDVGGDCLSYSRLLHYCTAITAVLPRYLPAVHHLLQYHSAKIKRSSAERQYLRPLMDTASQTGGGQHLFFGMSATG
jgi:hypothetical protein